MIRQTEAYHGAFTRDLACTSGYQGTVMDVLIPRVPFRVRGEGKKGEGDIRNSPSNLKYYYLLRGVTRAVYENIIYLEHLWNTFSCCFAFCHSRA